MITALQCSFYIHIIHTVTVPLGNKLWIENSLPKTVTSHRFFFKIKTAIFDILKIIRLNRPSSQFFFLFLFLFFTIAIRVSMSCYRHRISLTKMTLRHKNRAYLMLPSRNSNYLPCGTCSIKVVMRRTHQWGKNVLFTVLEQL